MISFNPEVAGNAAAWFNKPYLSLALRLAAAHRPAFSPSPPPGATVGEHLPAGCSGVSGQRLID
jgi:hypothetical protein